MKTKEELSAMQDNTRDKKLETLSEEELAKISGGAGLDTQNSASDKQNALKKAEDELLAKKQEYDTAIMR